jgi:catechol 2,3-dioxygenase-like lactoylglutathione lyase family enzyme
MTAAGREARVQATEGALPDRPARFENGLAEAVISVGRLDEAIGFWQRFADWRVLHRGPLAAEALALWPLPPSMAAEEAVLGPPGWGRGFVRLIQFGDGRHRSVRGHARAFDTGGLFDLNVRVNDIEAAFARLEAEGGHGFAEPTQFHFGPFLVKEAPVAVRDGYVIALIERLSPPLPPEDAPRYVSGVHQIVAVVRDYETPRRILVDVLGFAVQTEMFDAAPPPGTNILGLPHNLAMECPVKLGIFRPGAPGTGVFELLAFDNATGADLSARAHAPHRGILAARYRVADLGEAVRRLRHAGIDHHGPMTLDLPPYGPTAIVRIDFAEGARLELLGAPL